MSLLAGDGSNVGVGSQQQKGQHISIYHLFNAFAVDLKAIVVLKAWNQELNDKIVLYLVHAMSYNVCKI